MIARIWRGRTLLSQSEEYFQYLSQTGLPDYRKTEGNLGVLILRRESGEEAEFLLISFWDSFDAIRRFAGDEIERPVYYPEDTRFLLELEPRVTHHEVLAEPPKGALRNG